MTIPDQLSVDPAYPGYRDDWALIGPNLTIILDGVEQGKVLAYDRVAGWVIRFVQHPAGKVVMKGDHVAVEIVQGVVTVKPRAQA